MEYNISCAKLIWTVTPINNVAKRQGGRKCCYFSVELQLGITNSLVWTLTLGFPAVTPRLDNLQFFLPSPAAQKHKGWRTFLEQNWRSEK